MSPHFLALLVAFLPGSPELSSLSPPPDVYPEVAATVGRAEAAAPGGAEGAAPSADAGPVWVEREARAMGTRLRVRLAAADRASGIAAAEEAFRAVRETEDLLSTWRKDTELAGLNRSLPGEPLSVSPALHSVLRAAFSWARATGGAFHPVVGSLVDAWDLRGDGRVPTPEELENALSAAGAAGVLLDSAETRATRRSPRAWIDAGAFGKGAALRSAREALTEAGVRSALVDFGGQLLVLGAGAGNGSEAWLAGIAHPADRGRSVGTLSLRDASVSTSGASERHVMVDGRRYAHVLDPRTGEPVRAWGSVTVVAIDPLAADAVSTALFVMGPDAALEWARDREDLGVLLLVREADGLQAHWNRAMEPYLEQPAAWPDGSSECPAPALPGTGA